MDAIIGHHRIEKIKTMGDAYMAVGGLPDPTHGSPADVVLAAIEMQQRMEERIAECECNGLPAYHMRVSTHTGPVVAGIVGSKKFQYDIWGDAEKIASHMESSGEVGCVYISSTTYSLVKSDPRLKFEARGTVSAKDKGEREMWFADRTGSTAAMGAMHACLPWGPHVQEHFIPQRKGRQGARRLPLGTPSVGG